MSYPATLEGVNYGVEIDELKDRVLPTPTSTPATPTSTLAPPSATEASTPTEDGATPATPITTTMPTPTTPSVAVQPGATPLGVPLSPKDFIHYVDLQLARGNIAIGFDYSRVPTFTDAFSIETAQ